MQIKEVSQKTGLSIKTIRFYEERGLVSPKLEYRNGKNFRDYRETDIAQLQMVAVLRKCLFSIEQIKTMIDHPELTPDVFTEYRIAVFTQRELLSILAEKAETMDPESLDGPEVLARRLTITATPLPLPTMDLNPHFGKFDVETPEQRQAAFVKWQQQYKYRHIRKWGPPVLVLIVLIVLTLIRANSVANGSLLEFTRNQALLDSPVFEFDMNPGGRFSLTEKIRIQGYSEADPNFTYGLYTSDGTLLPQPDEIAGVYYEGIPVEIVVADVLYDELGETIFGDKTDLQEAMDGWVQVQMLNTQRSRTQMESGIFSQTFATLEPIQVEGESCFLALYYHQCPLLEAIKDMAVIYLATALIYLLILAITSTKGYGFKVQYIRNYGLRGVWNDGIISVDQDTGKATLLTKQYNGMGNLMNTDYEDRA